MFYDVFENKTVNLFIVWDEKGLKRISFSPIDIKAEKKRYNLLTEQLKAYFAGELQKFNLEIALEGSDFQQKVWAELLKIPYGKTVTYKEISAAINNSNANRAVGMACNKNPIPVIIPCHRVIAQNGGLTGYAGGLKLKQKLLKLEGNNVFRGRP
ncbi:MAG TPA: methylated-DNA--[protein]-cysteine S-methyltransferase [Candidatus Gastranaerophilales bacterium]|nr:methylated-DNA--[protein]-cysteine S-methyltransferase [Candidatus Gastranaerophilales bacterium]